MAELASSLVATDTDRLLQAEATVRTYCGWHIAPSRTESITLDGSAGTTLTLPTLHVTDVLSVVAEGTVFVEDDDYRWSASGYIIRRGSHVWPWLPRSVVVTLTHGFPAPPSDVAAVVQALASRLGSNPGGLTSKTVGPFSETYSGELFGFERATLDRYKLPARA